VATTWVANPKSGAKNAPFTPFNGDSPAPFSPRSVNQRAAPSEMRDENGVWWNSLGTVDVTGNILRVKLTDRSDGTVIADAVRIERIPDAPEIQVLDGTTNILDGGTFDFGYTKMGSPVTKTLTIRNSGARPLAVQRIDAIDLPRGFELLTDYPTFDLPPDASLLVNIRMTANDYGTYGGTLAIRSNDADEAPFEVVLAGQVLERPPVQTIDNGGDGYLAEGQWTPVSGEGYGGGAATSAAGTGQDKVYWGFIVNPGQYRVMATWTPKSTYATNALLTVYNSAKMLGTVTVNQRLAPSGQTIDGVVWQTLGTFTTDRDEIVVQLTDKANGTVTADAIRIERVQSASTNGSAQTLRSSRIAQSNLRATTDEAISTSAAFGVVAAWEGRNQKPRRKGMALTGPARDTLFGADRSDWFLSE
jgi:hypothetical protein